MIRQKYEDKRELREINILISEGYYKEAIKLIDRAGNNSDKRFVILKLKALIGKKDYVKARDLLSNNRDLAKEEGLIDNFYIQLMENGKENYAFKLINDYRDFLGEEDFKEKMTELLSIYRKLPIEGDFVFGWSNKRAILKDNSGYYIVDEDGNRLSSDYYEILKMGDKRFYGRKNKFWVELDMKGNLIKLTDEPRTALPPVDESYILMPTVKQGSDRMDGDESIKTLLYEGREIGDEEFDQISNISKKGTAFCKQNKKTYKLSWPALED